MVIEISISIIAFAVIVSVGLFIIFFLKIFRIIGFSKKDIHHVAMQGVELIQKIEALVSDVQAKSDSLDVIFQPLKSARKIKFGGNTSETVSDIVEWVSISLTLLNKLKNAMRHREK